jgi:hypothetical protein
MKLCAFKRNPSKVTVYRKGVPANQRTDTFFQYTKLTPPLKSRLRSASGYLVASQEEKL